ncbi:MAG: amino acid permease [Eubacteriales bacterium]
MSNKNERLSKSLGFFATYAIGTGTMIGAGIFVLPSIVIPLAGPASVFAFLLGGLITLATTLSVVELATAMPRAGGSYYFISRSLGPLFGTVIGFGAWISLVFKGSFALIGMAEYLNALITVPIMITALVLGALLIGINYRGAKSSGDLQNIIVVFLLIILLGFSLLGSFKVEARYFKPFMPYGPSSILEATGVIFISYLGIVKLAAVSEEVKNPEKNIPRAFIGSVVTVIILYVIIILMVNGLVPLETLLATNTPLIFVADVLLGNPGRIIMVIAGLLATISTANAAVLSSSRFPFALARDKLMPSNLINIHKKYKTPYRAILLTGITMLALIVLFDVEQLAKLGSTFNIMVFALVNMAVIIFRKHRFSEFKPTFKSPFFPLTQIFGIVGSLALLPSLGLFSTIFAGVFIGIGIVWYKIVGRNNTEFNYSIQNYLDEGKVDINVLDNQKRVMVPLANPEHEQDLLYIADRLGDCVIGLNVVKVSDQMTLSESKSYYLGDDSDCQTLENIFENWHSLKSNRQKFITAYAHDIAESIIEQAEVESADLVVMGIQDDKKLHNIVGTIAEKVLLKSKSHIAVLKGSIKEELKSILVAYDGKHNSRYGLYLAKRLALHTGAKIKVLRVLNPDYDVVDKRAIKEEMEEICKVKEKIEIEYRLVEKFSVTDSILEESNEHSLTIVGDSSKRFKRNFLSTIPQRLISHSKSPVLIIKRHQPSTKYLKYFE